MRAVREIKLARWLCPHGHKHVSLAKAQRCVDVRLRAAAKRKERQRLKHPEGYLTTEQTKELMYLGGVSSSCEDIGSLAAYGLLEQWRKTPKGKTWIREASMHALLIEAEELGITDARELLSRKPRQECPLCRRSVVLHENGKTAWHRCEPDPE